MAHKKIRKWTGNKYTKTQYWRNKPSLGVRRLLSIKCLFEIKYIIQQILSKNIRSFIDGH